MQIIAALLLILTVKVALGQDHRVDVRGQIFPLDMAPNSVDDQYEGCTNSMRNLVETVFLQKEISGSSTFADAWREGETNAKEPEKNLIKNHSVAIYVYTDLNVHGSFNTATRNDKEKYKNMTYEWYSLHFLLTEAIQILKKSQKKCKVTYRGTKFEYDKNVLNKEVRFGSFTSSSTEKELAVRFGKVSCFKIKTCKGAEVTKYSKLPYEKEVLIPPYEKFRVTSINTNKTWCNTVYKLKSSGTFSELNCSVASAAPV
ncbi:NAD(P)(+)--arginine ADP-ribosyltransferase 2-like [Myxocyprinus asiaticus]|uniref:NAD(P)(+)--arginine ADP-ribosyltransferase 2-like n=1 Tax=Myxocyprinus asiaticus TaxID=70543 RepID=UPI0022212B9F|nr:NAD(P)(+)--arginine ADP-ribosyltransferase 2-like [Myxocyprinus asiaticus]